MTQKLMLSTKADTLKALRNTIKKSKIEDLISFSVIEWLNFEEEIIDTIHGKFSKKIVIRSSAINEDTERGSKAGYFKSILGVNPQNKEEVRSAINEVISSYNREKEYSSFNKVLVQSQTENVFMSGVVFTRNLLNNSPYYIINYDIGSSTDSVTGGLGGRIIKISRFASMKNVPKRFRKLLVSIREIEKIVSNDKLDIEFAINKQGEVIIFQVRPIVSHFLKNKDYQLKEKIKSLKNQFNCLSRLNNPLPDKKKIFADMPDWNPAEILGDSPGYLDCSVYDYLIMKNAWHEARVSQGYDAGNPSKLVYLFGNKPYVDVMNSFMSFLPPSIPDKTKKKLLNFYWDKFKKNPHLQDKIEFEIVYTCYDFLFEEKSKELLQYGFTEKEIKDIESSLIRLTNNLISNYEKNIESDLISLEEMKKNRKSVKVKNSEEIFYDSLNCAKFLLDDCREKGTVGFSRLARLAFIGKILLKSLVHKEIMKQEDYEKFMNSIRTVATEFEEDFEKMCNKNISKKDFMKKYYHLRPGTYDITSKRYESNLGLLNNFEKNEFRKKKTERFILNKKTEKRINELLKEKGFEFDAKVLFEFIKKSVESRELSKFEFTKNLSDSLELISLSGKEIGFTRKEISMLSIDELFESLNIEKKNLAKFLGNKIFSRIEERKINEQLELPPIITSENDFDVVWFYNPLPNYITRKKITSEISEINHEKPEISDISGKIILLENGDPGYDWIFTKNPAGLITKYGGVASHMAIRCAEFGLPAAIGCGALFDQLKNKDKVILDCNMKKIIPLEIK